MTHQRSASIAFQTDLALSAYGPLATAVEAYGFDGVTVYNDLLYQPAWLPLLEIARATSRVRIGPAAVNPFTCHPLNMAGNIALLDEASGGRAYLGIARGAWLEFLGIEPERPVTALREAIECVRHLLARSIEPYHGQVFRLAGGDSLRWPIARPDIPVLLGSWGARTVRACAHVIDEIKVGGSTNPAAVARVVAEARAAAVAAGRASDTLGVAVGAVCVVDGDGAAARVLARRKAALYLPVIAALDPSLPIEPAQLERIRAAAAAYDFAAAARDISDELLRLVGFAGTPAEVAEQAMALYDAGATRVEFGTPHGLTEEVGLRLLGQAVLPRLR
jgi:5,10-methylenetetrahydromethanopterin reductase